MWWLGNELISAVVLYEERSKKEELICIFLSGCQALERL